MSASTSCNEQAGQGEARMPVVPVLAHAGCTDQCGTFIPEEDGPPVLIVGSNARIEKIIALARRHGLDASVLHAFARSGGPT